MPPLAVLPWRTAAYKRPGLPGPVWVGLPYRRLSPPRMSPKRVRRPGASRGPGLGFQLVQLAAQRLDLVAQLGRVLEAQVVRGGEHLLLELDDGPAQLLGRHALLPRASAATGALGELGLDGKEVGDVGDALAHGLGGDAALGVVGPLDGPAAVGLSDRGAHGGRLLVGV